MYKRLRRQLISRVSDGILKTVLVRVGLCPSGTLVPSGSLVPSDGDEPTQHN
jgi:hypothetical protein